MRTQNKELLNLSSESTETLLLIAAFANESARKAAVRELKHRQAFQSDYEDDNLFMTNLSGIC